MNMYLEIMDQIDGLKKFAKEVKEVMGEGMLPHETKILEDGSRIQVTYGGEVKIYRK